MRKLAKRLASLAVTGSMIAGALAVGGCDDPQHVKDLKFLQDIDKAEHERIGDWNQEKLAALQASYDKLVTLSQSQSASKRIQLLILSRQSQLSLTRAILAQTDLQEKDFAVSRAISSLQTMAAELAGTEDFVKQLEASNPEAQIKAVVDFREQVKGSDPKSTFALPLAMPKADAAPSTLTLDSLAKLNADIASYEADIAKAKSDDAVLADTRKTALDKAETLMEKTRGETGTDLMNDTIAASNFRCDAGVADAQRQTLAANIARLNQELDVAKNKLAGINDQLKATDTRSDQLTATWAATQKEIAAVHAFQSRLITGDWSSASELDWKKFATENQWRKPGPDNKFVATDEYRPASIQQALNDKNTGLAARLADAAATRAQVLQLLDDAIKEYGAAQKLADALGRDLGGSNAPKPGAAETALVMYEGDTFDPRNYVNGLKTTQLIKASVSASHAMMEKELLDLVEGATISKADAGRMFDAYGIDTGDAAEWKIPGLNEVLNPELTTVAKPELPKVTADLTKLNAEVTAQFKDVEKDYAEPERPTIDSRYRMQVINLASCDRQYAQFLIFQGKVTEATARLDAAAALEQKLKVGISTSQPSQASTPLEPTAGGGAAPGGGGGTGLEPAPAGGGGATPDLALAAPMSAAKTFADAINKGDADAAKKAAVSDDKRDKVIEGMARLAFASLQLRDAIKTKFGAQGDQILQAVPDPDMDAPLVGADVKIDGDNATITPPATAKDRDPIPLKKVGGDWKVALPDDMVAQVLPAVDALEKKADAYKSLADDITAGKATLDDVTKKLAPARPGPGGGGPTPPAGGGPTPPGGGGADVGGIKSVTPP